MLELISIKKKAQAGTELSNILQKSSHARKKPPPPPPPYSSDLYKRKTKHTHTHTNKKPILSRYVCGQLYRNLTTDQEDGTGLEAVHTDCRACSSMMRRAKRQALPPLLTCTSDICRTRLELVSRVDGMKYYSTIEILL